MFAPNRLKPRPVHAIFRTATKEMHPCAAWRDGWTDAANGRAFGETNNGFRTVRGDSYSEMMYADGYNVGACR